MPHLLALDQGTSSTRSIVFDDTGRLVAQAQRELPQHYPQPGWVEHDALQIWADQLATAREALAKAGLAARDIAAIGITNQRETTVLWHRRTGQPLHRAIVWQDRRGEPLCAELRAQGHAALIRERTGLVMDSYFSATKLRWLLDHVPGARALAEAGELAFGTIDSWLLWQLSGGRVHATDVSNAARTMLFDIGRQRWCPELLALLQIPAAVLPAVHASSHVFGECEAQHFGAALPLAGVAGDQQAALFGQACFEPGLVKNTYGTGCFMLMHTGAQQQASTHGLITTAAAQPGPAAAYALEGSVFVGGAVVQWLRDGLKAISSSSDVQALAETVPDAGGVVFVPAFTGLGAPYWDANARGAIVGLSRGSTVAHIARAALESIAFQSTALLQAMAQDAVASGGTAPRELRVDGGASVNALLMQHQADLLGLPVLRPAVTETTALGAAWLAGLAVGVYRSTDELAVLWREGQQAGQRFEPRLPPAQALAQMAAWEAAVRQARAGALT
ncbi:glycerol kinase [beta proteobacterium AAP121]|nr:glycerol kinase [beta proteobacterium AAP65]KPF99214.1 glycerol kinase [beta proteobacterium AAP121]